MRTLDWRIPVDIISLGVGIEEVRAGPVTSIMFYLPIKFGRFEDDRQLSSGAELMDFRVPQGGRVDATKHV